MFIAISWYHLSNIYCSQIRQCSRIHLRCRPLIMQCRSTHICGVNSPYGTRLSSFRSSAASCCSRKITEPPIPPPTHTHTHFHNLPAHTPKQPSEPNLVIPIYRKESKGHKMEGGGVVFLSFSDSQYREISFSRFCVCAVLLLWHKWQSTGSIWLRFYTSFL
jgi:hypothetical protein